MAAPAARTVRSDAGRLSSRQTTSDVFLFLAALLVFLALLLGILASLLGVLALLLRVLVHITG